MYDVANNKLAGEEGIIAMIDFGSIGDIIVLLRL
jgi:hypothetical protein